MEKRSKSKLIKAVRHAPHIELLQGTLKAIQMHIWPVQWFVVDIRWAISVPPFLDKSNTNTSWRTDGRTGWHKWSPYRGDRFAVVHLTVVSQTWLSRELSERKRIESLRKRHERRSGLQRSTPRSPLLEISAWKRTRPHAGGALSGAVYEQNPCRGHESVPTPSETRLIIPVSFRQLSTYKHK